MRIAFFNWLSITHPDVGGAEVYTHQVMKRLADKGHRVAFFTTSYPGCGDDKSAEGDPINYERHFLGYDGMRYSEFRRYTEKKYRELVQGRYDVIVESITFRPFLSPIFAKERIVGLIHHMPSETETKEYYLGDLLIRLYKRYPAIGVSESTRRDLEKMGFSKIYVVNPGHELKRASVDKEADPTIIHLGRLSDIKNVNHTILAFKRIREVFPAAKLWVVGSGPHEEAIKSIPKELGLEDSVIFFGFVSESKKAELLSRAHLMLFPGVKEGWGITVIEANACGTPVLGYDVPGLRDSIKPGINGHLFDYGDFGKMADCAIGLLSDMECLKNLSESSVEYSKQYTWERTAEKFLSVLEEVVHHDG